MRRIPSLSSPHVSTPRIATSNAEIQNCFELMKELRPHLQRETFLALVRQMEKEAYHLAYIEQEGVIVCLSGYRVSNNLIFGKNLYIDDLVTSAHSRASGLGRMMLAWLRQIAIDEGCEHLHLDTGVQRAESQKFYFNQNMKIVAYHFLESLP